MQEETIKQEVKKQEIQTHLETKQIIQKSLKNFEIKFVKTIFSVVLATLAALAWETALSEILKKYLPQNPSPWYWILYALIITLIVVLASIWIHSFISKIEKKTIEKENSGE